MHALLPKARLIVLLRDPVERALSQYFHSRRLGFEPLPLEDALAAEAERLQSAPGALRAADGRHKSHQEHSYLSRSRYRAAAVRWQAFFLQSSCWCCAVKICFMGLQRLGCGC